MKKILNYMNWEIFLLFIFTILYIFAFIMLFHFLYLYIFYCEENLQVIAVTIASILASTAMTRIYLQNERNEKQKEKRELYDRRKKILFLLAELFARQVKSKNEEDTYESIINDAIFMRECEKTYSEAKYIFEEKDFSQMSLIYKNINDFIHLTNSIENIQKSEIQHKQDLINEKLREKNNIQNELLNSLDDNLETVENTLNLMK